MRIHRLVPLAFSLSLLASGQPEAGTPKLAPMLPRWVTGEVRRIGRPGPERPEPGGPWEFHSSVQRGG